MKILKWFYPGMRIKRWIALCVFGVIMLSMGFVIIISEEEGRASLGTSVIIIIGIVALITGVKRIINSLITLFMPRTEKELVDIVYKRRQLERGPRIVVVGSGAGFGVALHGLKEYTNNLTGILMIVDEGRFMGGSQEQSDIPQPSEVRDSLIALADAEPVLEKLFHYRFKKGTELWGHNFGDLFLTAMSEITGDFDTAVKESGRVLAIRGQIVLATLSKLSLIAQHEDGTETVGKQDILTSGSPIRRVYLRPQAARATQEAINAIMRADAIVLGPGSLYTSVIPPLLIGDIRDAFLGSKAAKIFVMNIMTKAGETDGYKASDHLKALYGHFGGRPLSYCVVNRDGITEAQLKYYEQEGASPVAADKDVLSTMGCVVIEEAALDRTQKALARHDSLKLASSILDLITESKKAKGHAK